MKSEHGQNFLNPFHLYRTAKHEVQKALGSLGFSHMAEVKAEPIKGREQKITPFQAVARVLETAGVIYGAIDAGYMLWTKANTGHTDELTTRIFQTVYDEVQAGLNNNKVVIPGVDGKDLTLTVTPASPTITPTETQTPTITPTATETQVPTPEKTFDICKPVSVEEVKKCVIYDGSSIPDAINALKEYQNWLPTLSQPFDSTKIKDVPFVFFRGQQPEGDIITYDTKTEPNFPIPETRPFRRDVTAGVIYLDYYGDGQHKVLYLVRPVELYDKNDPNNNKWVITLKSYFGLNDPKITYVGGGSPDDFTKWDLNTWRHNMNVTPFLTTSWVQATSWTDPLEAEIMKENPDMPDRFQNFVDGDIGALSKSGIAVLTYDSQGGPFK